MPNLPSLFITLKPEYIWLLVAVLGMFFVGVSLILFYHWRQFGIDMAEVGQAALWYFSVSAVLWAIMLVSLAVYLSSV